MADNRALFNETNARFWARTNYKPGLRLDMSDPRDLEMSKVWMTIFHEVGGLRAAATAFARKTGGDERTPFVLVIGHGNAVTGAQAFRKLDELKQMYAWAVARPETYGYVAAFDFSKHPRGPMFDQFSGRTS